MGRPSPPMFVAISLFTGTFSLAVGAGRFRSSFIVFAASFL